MDITGNFKNIFDLRTSEISSCAALASISAVLQVAHLGWVSPWGMWIDLVALPWIIAYFLYGGRSAFVVSFVSAIIITIIAPSTWLGAVTKWMATLPMWLVLMLSKKGLNVNFEKFKILVPLIVIAVLLRGMIMIPVNYYFAIPIWTGLGIAESINLVPWWAIFGINALQGIIEVCIAWLLVFRFKLIRFSKW